MAGAAHGGAGRGWAGHDLDLVAAAQALMNLVDEGEARAGKYTVDVRGAQGVPIGGHTRAGQCVPCPPTGLVTGDDRQRLGPVRYLGWWQHQDRPAGLCASRGWRVGR